MMADRELQNTTSYKCTGCSLSNSVLKKKNNNDNDNDIIIIQITPRRLDKHRLRKRQVASVNFRLR